MQQLSDQRNVLMGRFRQHDLAAGAATWHQGIMQCALVAGKQIAQPQLSTYLAVVHAGALMEKQLTIRGGQTPCQKYWPVLLDLVLTGQLDPAMVITHELPLEDAAKGYKLFNDKKDGCIKVVLKPMGDTVAPPAGAHAVSVS